MSRKVILSGSDEGAEASRSDEGREARRDLAREILAGIAEEAERERELEAERRKVREEEAAARAEEAARRRAEETERERRRVEEEDRERKRRRRDFLLGSVAPWYTALVALRELVGGIKGETVYRGWGRFADEADSLLKSLEWNFNDLKDEAAKAAREE